MPPTSFPPRNFNLAPPPPPRSINVRPPPTRNPSPTSSHRGEDFPQSVQSVDGMMGFNASAPRSAAPISNDIPVEIEGQSQLAYQDREVALPIHHQFIAHDMTPRSENAMNPFGDGHSIEERPRPDRASFAPPPGLYVPNNTGSGTGTRTLTLQQGGGRMGHSRGQSMSQSHPRAHHRRTSSTPNANPFSTPFDDPQSPQGYQTHNGFPAPQTPSAFSTNSGPRAL